MLVKNVTKGSYVQFSSNFFDANNAVRTPDQPILRVYYRSNNVYQTVTANLVSSGDNWTASWDSSNADVGIVQWYISSGGTPSIAEEGEFRIIANHAANVSNPI